MGWDAVKPRAEGQGVKEKGRGGWTPMPSIPRIPYPLVAYYGVKYRMDSREYAWYRERKPLYSIVFPGNDQQNNFIITCT